MGFSREELASARGRGGRARRGVDDRAQRLLSQRRDRAGDGRRSGRDRACRRGGSAAGGEAADREAHARTPPSRPRWPRPPSAPARTRSPSSTRSRAWRSIRTAAVPGSAGSPGVVSGPAVRAIALEQVRAVARPRASCRVIGMGGHRERPPRRRLPARRGPGRSRRDRELSRPRRGAADRRRLARGRRRDRAFGHRRAGLATLRARFTQSGRVRSHADGRRRYRVAAPTADRRHAETPTTRIGNSSNPCGGHAATISPQGAAC